MTALNTKGAEPELGEMLSALTEITDPHTLGIHLGIEEHQLEIFENNHPNKVERQKSDVLSHWKRNCDECSWGVLATAVGKMGKHGKLAKKLREKHVQGRGEPEVKVISKGCSMQESTDFMTPRTVATDKKESTYPTVKELKQYVRSFVGDKWEELAIELGLDEDDESVKKLDDIRTKRKDNASMASYDVLMLWRNNQRANHSWEELKRALAAVGLTDAVKSIDKYLGTCSKEAGKAFALTAIPPVRERMNLTPLHDVTAGFNDIYSKKEGKAFALDVIPYVKERMNLTSLHDAGLNGNGISIYILDGGIALTCPDFNGREPTVTCIDQMSCTYHGSACAAIAGGACIGIAPGAHLTVWQVSPDGETFDASVIFECMKQLVDAKKKGAYIDIVSMSFGFEKFYQGISDCIKELTTLGVVCVAAAGNAGRNQKEVGFPARDRNVISVGACKPTGQPSDSSPEDSNINVYAPGEDIKLPGWALSFSGSSAATPAVAGVIALMLQCANRLPPMKDNVKRVIRKVEILRSLFKRDLMERGKKLLAPRELLEKWWKDPSEIEVTLSQYY